MVLLYKCIVGTLVYVTTRSLSSFRGSCPDLGKWVNPVYVSVLRSDGRSRREAAIEEGILQDRALSHRLGGAGTLPDPISLRIRCLRYRLVSWTAPEFEQAEIEFTLHTVYSSAFDTVYNVPVALKKLARPFQNEMHATRTYRELRYLKHMKHENVRRLGLSGPDLSLGYRDNSLIHQHIHIHAHIHRSSVCWMSLHPLKHTRPSKTCTAFLFHSPISFYPPCPELYISKPACSGSWVEIYLTISIHNLSTHFAWRIGNWCFTCPMPFLLVLLPHPPPSHTTPTATWWHIWLVRTWTT